MGWAPSWRSQTSTALSLGFCPVSIWGHYQALEFPWSCMRQAFVPGLCTCSGHCLWAGMVLSGLLPHTPRREGRVRSCGALLMLSPSRKKTESIPGALLLLVREQSAHWSLLIHGVQAWTGSLAREVPKATSLSLSCHDGLMHCSQSFSGLSGDLGICCPQWLL